MMKKIGIIAAMHSEIEYIEKAMENSTVHSYAMVDYHAGTINGVEVVLVECSIGKVNAAIYTQIMIDKFNVDLIINTGIAGSLSEDVKHLSVVVANELTYYDVRKEQLKSWFPNQEHFKADEEMVSLILMNKTDENDIKIGRILTGDDFIAGKEKKLNLQKKYNALCVEMEGAAIAHTAFVNHRPFVIIRCISDMADDDVDLDYPQFEKIATKKASEIVLKLLLQLKMS